MWISPVTLTGRIVRLEPLEKRHAPDLLAAADPELFRHTSQGPTEWSAAGFGEEIARVCALPNVSALAIIDLGSGRAIGRTTYMDIREKDRGVEIGRTWIGRAHHGTRVNPEIKYLMLSHAFERLSPPALRVQLCTSGTNLHSQAAIAKLGALREGVLRRSRIVPADPVAGTPEIVRDAVVYSILDDEWPAVKRGLLARIGWAS